MTVAKKSIKPAKKPVKSSYHIDIDGAILHFSKDGQDYSIPLLPIDDTVVVDLALQALYSKVKTAKDPYEKADWIKSGSPKKVNAPIIVQAISEASNRPVGEVLATWRKMSKQEKTAISKDPVVIAAKLKLETPTDPRATDTYLDIFG